MDSTSRCPPTQLENHLPPLISLNSMSHYPTRRPLFCGDLPFPLPHSTFVFPKRDPTPQSLGSRPLTHLLWEVQLNQRTINVVDSLIGLSAQMSRDESESGSVPSKHGAGCLAGQYLSRSIPCQGSDSGGSQ